MQFLDLPTEMLLQTLEHLSLADLLTCRAVCRLLCKLIDSSTALQYNIELGAALKVDNPSCHDPKYRKLAELRRACRAWRDLRSVSRAPLIPIRNYAAVYELAGGCFVQDINHDFMSAKKSTHSTLSYIQLPSRRSMKIRSWEDLKFDFRVADVCLDMERDLVVAIERPDVEMERGHMIVCNVHLRTISSNAPHPEAAVPMLSTCFNAPAGEYAMIAQLCGNHLAVLLTARSTLHPRKDMFFLWDWTTGVCKARMSSEAASEAWDTFCFVATDVVLIPDTRHGKLNIFRFDDSADSFRHAVSLLLPETVSNSSISYISARSEPPPRLPSAKFAGAATVGASEPPCSTDPDSAVVIISLEYNTAPQPEFANLFAEALNFRTTHPQVFAVRRGTLVRFARRAETRFREPSLQYWQGQGQEQEQGQEQGQKWEQERKQGQEQGQKQEQEKVGQLESRDYLVEEQRSSDERKLSCPHAVQQGSEKDVLTKRIPHVHSEDWVHYTRWGLMAPPPRWVCYTYGTRYVAMGDRPFGSGRRMALYVYDFNVLSERRGADSSSDSEEEEEDIGRNRKFDNWHVKRSRTVERSTNVHLPEIFKHDFRSALPYRVIETQEVFDWDSVMIDDERIIGLKEEFSDSGGLEHLDVLVV